MIIGFSGCCSIVLAAMFAIGIAMIVLVLVFPQASGVFVFAMFALLLTLIGLLIRNIVLNIVGKN